MPKAKKKIDRNLTDLDVNDKLIRLRMQDWLLAERERQGVGNREIGQRVGHHTSWAHCFLKSTMWRTVTLQKMVRALNHRLTFNVDTFGKVIIPPPDGPLLSDVYANNPNPDRQEEAIRLDLGDLGRRYREALGVSRVKLARKLNQEAKTVDVFEAGASPQYLLVTAQRYFRALGGELRLVLTPPDGEPFEPPAFDWDASALVEVQVAEFDGRVLVWNANAPHVTASFPAEAWQAWLRSNRD